jgi:hypothetical protein
MTKPHPRTSTAGEAGQGQRPSSSRSRRTLWLAAAIGLGAAVVLMSWRSAEGKPRDTLLRPLRPPGQNLVVIPESERPFRRIVIGLQANRTRYFMLPSTEPLDSGTQDPRVRFIRRQAYWLNFELVHGRIMRAIPAYTRVFVAVPDPRTVPGSLGNEEDVFRDYLRCRVGWSEDEIAKRVRFFAIPGEIPFPQDLAEPLGTDGRGRLVLAIGGDIPDVYREPVLSLARSFPDDFVIRTVGTTKGKGVVDIEGGDISLVWSPEGTVGLLIGRHRVWRYLERQRRLAALSTPILRDEIEEARDAFRRAFFGVETIIVGEEGLLRPSLVSEELSHTDMIVNILRTYP